MTKPPIITPELVLPHIEGTRGNMTKIAEKAGCSRSGLYNARERYPEIKEAIYQEKEKFKDKVENIYLDQVETGEHWGRLRWYLSTQMRDRGYAPKQEIDVTKRLKVKLAFPELPTDESGGWEVLESYPEEIEALPEYAEADTDD